MVRESLATSESLKTDYVITGFPKCGTTALAHFLEVSPLCHLSKLDGAYEAPFFARGIDPSDTYVDGKVNGHKFAAYAFALGNLRKIYADNPQTLFLFCVREAKSALLSWRNMHAGIAERGTITTHFVNRTPDTRAFYRSCTVEEYFHEFADGKLDYATRIAQFHKRLPDARFLVVTQAALAEHAAASMAKVHAALGVNAPDDYLASLPVAHASFGDKARKEQPLAPDVEAALAAADAALQKFLTELDDSHKVTG